MSVSRQTGNKTVITWICSFSSDILFSISAFRSCRVLTWAAKSTAWQEGNGRLRTPLICTFHSPIYKLHLLCHGFHSWVVLLPFHCVKRRGLTLLSLWEPAVARDFRVCIFSKTRLTFLLVVSSLSLLLQTGKNSNVNTATASVWRLGN